MDYVGDVAAQARPGGSWQSPLYWWELYASLLSGRCSPLCRWHRPEGERNLDPTRATPQKSYQFTVLLRNPAFRESKIKRVLSVTGLRPSARCAGIRCGSGSSRRVDGPAHRPAQPVMAGSCHVVVQDLSGAVYSPRCTAHPPVRDDQQEMTSTDHRAVWLPVSIKIIIPRRPALILCVKAPAESPCSPLFVNRTDCAAMGIHGMRLHPAWGAVRGGSPRSLPCIVPLSPHLLRCARDCLHDLHQSNHLL